MERFLFKACLSTCVFLFASSGYAILSCGQLLGATAARNQPGNQESGLGLSPAVAEKITRLTEYSPSAGVISDAELVRLFQSKSRPFEKLFGYIVNSGELGGNSSPILVTGARYFWRGEKKFIKITYEPTEESRQSQEVIIPLNGNGESASTLHFVSTDLMAHPLKVEVGQIPRSGVNFSNDNSRVGWISPRGGSRELQVEQIMNDLSKNIERFLKENPFLFTSVNSRPNSPVYPAVDQIALLIAEVPASMGNSILKIMSGRVTAMSDLTFTLRDALGTQTVIQKANVYHQYTYVQRSLPHPLISTESLVKAASVTRFLNPMYGGADAHSNIVHRRSSVQQVREKIEKLAGEIGLKLTIRSDLGYVKPGDFIIPITTKYLAGRGSSESPYIYTSANLYQVVNIHGYGTNDGYIDVIASASVVMRIPLRELNDGYYLVQAPETNP